MEYTSILTPLRIILINWSIAKTQQGDKYLVGYEWLTGEPTVSGKLKVINFSQRIFVDEYDKEYYGSTDELRMDSKPRIEYWDSFCKENKIGNIKWDEKEKT